MTDGHRPDPAADDPVPDGELLLALRDLIPDYRGPVDPLPRVGASIRRRRARRRALLAVGSAAAAAVLLAGVPAVLGGIGPLDGSLPAGDLPTAGPEEPLAPPPVHRVNQGVAAGSRWQVGSTTPGGTARRCLLTEGDGFGRDLACFDDWRPAGPTGWHAVVVRVDGRPVTRVIGVTPDGAARVRVRLATGDPVELPAVRTPTDAAARFFAVVLAGDRPVRSVTAVGPDGSPLEPPVTTPARMTCRPAPDNACAATPTR